jgi:hypothetical protein
VSTLQIEAVYNFIEAGTILAETILIILYCRRLNFHATTGKWQLILGYTSLFIPLCLLSFFLDLPWLRILYSFVGISLLFMLCYGLNIPNSVYLSALFLTLSAIADIGCSYCMTFLGISNEGYTGQPMDRIAYNVAAKLIHLILIHLITIFIPRKKANNTFGGTLPLLTAQIASLIACLCLYFSGGTHHDISSITIIGILAMFYVNIIVCLFVETLTTKNELLREKELAAQEYQYRLKYYSSLKQSQEETRALWHDIKKYLNAMKSLIGVENNAAANSCLEEAEQLFENLAVNVDVGNNVISGILSIELQNANSHKIPFHVDAWVPEKINVAPQDLFIILGNAIDNAIEECDALPAESERYINISIRQKAQLVVMKVDNPCRESQTAKPGYIHGYGLKNVRRCVEKYHGELQYGADHGVFHFFALLNLV